MRRWSRGARAGRGGGPSRVWLLRGSRRRGEVSIQNSMRDVRAFGRCRSFVLCSRLGRLTDAAISEVLRVSSGGVQRRVEVLHRSLEAPIQCQASFIDHVINSALWS